ARAAYDTQTNVFGASYRAVEEPVMIGEALVHLARARDALPWLELAAKHANATDSAGTHAYIDALLGYALVVTHDRRGERMLHDAMAVLAKDRTLADELARVRALIGSRSARSAARRPR
ncbi:MAG TPA: hypothetical protein VGC41_11835, partial [Kofleriaceae bacterium]